MRVIGIDVGLAITGWSIIDKTPGNIYNLKLVDCGSVLTAKQTSTPLRLQQVYEGVSQVVDKYSPDSAAVEALFFFKNQKTIIQVGEARGVILLALAMKGLPIFDYTPLQVKTAVTGYGRAEKAQVQKMIKLLFKLEEVPKPDDIADAIAIGVSHCNSFR